MNKKKMLTLLLAAVMATSALPVSALAEESEGAESEVTVAETAESTVLNEVDEPEAEREEDNTENSDEQESPEGIDNKGQTEDEKLEEAKTNAKETVRKLSKLTDKEKESYNKSIDAAEDTEAVSRIVGQAEDENKARVDAEKEAEEAEKAEKELKDAIDKLKAAVAEAKKLDKDYYTDASYKVFKDAIDAADKVIENNSATKTDVDKALKNLKYAKANLDERIIINKKITNVKVYYDKVTGYAEPYSTVKLYKDGSYTYYSDKANSSGYFEIAYNFGSRNYRYWNDNYRNWDRYYDYYGYYYDGYYYSYDYELSRFSLISEDSLGNLIDKRTLSTSDAYYYDGWYYNRNYDRYYDRYYDYKVYPTSLDLNRAKDTVSGYLTSYPNRYVAVYRDGSFLGSAYINSNGYFKIYLNTYVGTTSDLDFYVDRYNTSTTTETSTTSTTNNTYRTKIIIGSRTLQRSINGASRTITMDVEAYIKEDRTMLPVRYVAESLGYDVTYIDRNRSAVITDGKDAITIYLDSAKYTVNGVEKTFEVKPEIKNDRTMLPIAEIARALGLSHGTKGSGKNIEWDNATKTVVIEITK